MMDIVWVEDSGTDQVLIRSVLDETDPPLKVAFAGDGEAALRLVNKHGPPVVVLDVRMPGLSGVDVLERLRRDAGTAASKVIAFSSTTDARELKAMRDLGALACVQKPMDFGQFRAAVRAIARHALEVRLQDARSHLPVLRGRHHVLFWESEMALLDATRLFLREGLARGAGAVVLATPAHVARLRRDLRGQDVVWLETDEMHKAVRNAGRYDIKRFEGVLRAAIDTASRGGARPVVCFGEYVAVLQASGEGDVAAAIEAVGQRAAADDPDRLSVLCAYPVSSFATTQSLERACLLHTSHQLGGRVELATAATASKQTR